VFPHPSVVLSKTIFVQFFEEEDLLQEENLLRNFNAESIGIRKQKNEITTAQN